MAWAVLVLTLPEHDQLAPWSLDTAVKTLVSSDHAAQRLPAGSTETFGKLWSRSVFALWLHGTGRSVHVDPPSLETATNASLNVESPVRPGSVAGATKDW